MNKFSIEEMNRYKKRNCYGFFFQNLEGIKLFINSSKYEENRGI